MNYRRKLFENKEQQVTFFTLFFPQCLYSFFCYVAWVTFGRKGLRDMQEEVGRLLYSDTFNTAVRNRTDGDSGMTSAAHNGSAKTGEADLKETGCNSTFKHR